VLYRIIKHRLSQNDCYNRGYIFYNPILGKTDLEILFKVLKASIHKFKTEKLRKIRPKPKKEKKRKANQEPVADAGTNEAPNDGDGAGEEEQGDEPGAIGGETEKLAVEEQAEEEQKEEEAAEEEDPEDEDGPKVEKFIPESFIFFEYPNHSFQFDTDETDPTKLEINDYCDQMSIETLSIDVEVHSKHEGLESLRLYIERVLLA
jgi:hypothetical protein